MGLKHSGQLGATSVASEVPSTRASTELMPALELARATRKNPAPADPVLPNVYVPTVRLRFATLTVRRTSVKVLVAVWMRATTR